MIATTGAYLIYNHSCIFGALLLTFPSSPPSEMVGDLSRTSADEAPTSQSISQLKSSHYWKHLWTRKQRCIVSNHITFRWTYHWTRLMMIEQTFKGRIGLKLVFSINDLCFRVRSYMKSAVMSTPAVAVLIITARYEGIKASCPCHRGRII